MMIPIRCFSCGKPIGHLYEEYKEKAKTDNKKALDDVGADRMCCRATLMGQTDTLKTTAQFKR